MVEVTEEVQVGWLVVVVVGGWWLVVVFPPQMRHDVHGRHDLKKNLIPSRR